MRGRGDPAAEAPNPDDRATGFDRCDQPAKGVDRRRALDEPGVLGLTPGGGGDGQSFVATWFGTTFILGS